MSADVEMLLSILTSENTLKVSAVAKRRRRSTISCDFKKWLMGVKPDAQAVGRSCRRRSVLYSQGTAG